VGRLAAEVDRRPGFDFDATATITVSVPIPVATIAATACDKRCRRSNTCQLKHSSSG